MYQIGLLGKPSPSRLKVRKKLDLQTGFHISVYSEAKDLVKSMRNNIVDGVVFNVEKFSGHHIPILRDLSEQVELKPLVVIASLVPDIVRKELAMNALPSTTVLDRRFEMNDLNNMLMKVVRGEGVSHRRYVRYRVHQSADVFGKGRKHRARLLNVSYGGAQLHIQKGHHIEGEEVCLKVKSLKSPNSSTLIQGRKVWENPSEGIYGIEFARPKSNQGKHLFSVG